MLISLGNLGKPFLTWKTYILGKHKTRYGIIMILHSFIFQNIAVNNHNIHHQTQDHTDFTVPYRFDPLKIYSKTI